MNSTTTATKVPRSGTVGTNGQQLHYEIHGDGPPLVLLMGIGYDASLWTLQQVPVLSTRFRVVLLDNRDAGRSSRADHPYTIADMADDVAGLLDALDIQRTHLLGLSMGSMIGMEFALQAVQDTVALLASNPNPVEPAAYERQAQAYLRFDALDRLGGIRAPTLVVVGEQDLLTPPWVAREVAGGIPAARLEGSCGTGTESPPVRPSGRRPRVG